jgi:hypothetical protein
MKILPVGFKWMEVEIVDDEHGELRRVMAMVPLPRFGNLCKRQFEAGQEYALVPHETRSKKSHSFYFACVGEAFTNLPENIAARFPTAEHLRAWALIECGYFEEKEFFFDNKRYAQSLAAFIRTQNDYARISLHNPGPQKWLVIVRVAKSQSHAAMPDKASFEKSKRDVLDLLEHMTSVPRGTFRKETNQHA